jgi:hypothetical protein
MRGNSTDLHRSYIMRGLAAARPGQLGRRSIPRGEGRDGEGLCEERSHGFGAVDYFAVLCPPITLLPRKPVRIVAQQASGSRAIAPALAAAFASSSATTSR